MAIGTVTMLQSLFLFLISNFTGVYMQRVHKSVTQSGIHGYFSGNYMCWSLHEDEYNRPDEWHSANCRRLNFTYYPSHQAAYQAWKKDYESGRV